MPTEDKPRSGPARKRRLALALRANIGKRKEQARVRKADGPQDGEALQPEPARQKVPAADSRQQD